MDNNTPSPAPKPPGSNPFQKPQVRPAPQGPAGSSPKVPLPDVRKIETLGPVGVRPKPRIQTMVEKDVAVVTIMESRILDETNVQELGRALMDLVVNRYMIKMIIDMGEVRYLSSSVLRQFIALYKKIKEEKGDLKMCRVNQEVREVFKITQLDKMIEIKEDLTSAMNAFKKTAGWGFLKR